MRLKKEYVILAVVIIVSGLYLAFHNTDSTHYRLPELIEIDGKGISKLEIKKADETIILNKKDSSWYIVPKDYPVDTDKMNNMLDVVERLTVTALVSESKSYIRYGLNDEKKIAVKAWNGDKLIREFEIGKVAATNRHTNILLKDDPNVYHAKENFRRNFDQGIEELRDMEVLSFEPDDIHKISFIRDKKISAITKIEKEISPDGPFRDEKTGPVWQTAEGNEVDDAKLNRLLATLSKLKCKKYINDTSKNSFKDPVYVLSVNGIREYNLSIFAESDKDAEKYPAISSENAYPFLLSGSQVDNMKTTMEDILKSQGKGSSPPDSLANSPG